MIQSLPLALLLSTLATSLAALTLPENATQIGTRSETPAAYAMATAPFDGAKVPSQTVTGSLTQTAWVINGNTANTLALLQPLADQLTAQGYRTLFTCQTTECGGFDFRFAIDVLPEPQMHVDLGDYRYLAALNPKGEAVTLLVSRTADQGFVQITTVSATGAAPAAKPEPEFVPMQQFTMAPPKTDLEAALRDTGAYALEDLVFSSGAATLEAGTYPSLTALAAWLIANPTLKVTLVGHTDASGSLEANIALSRQRAAAVRAALISDYGAPAAQITAEGAGYLAPRATNQTPEGRAKNRRVEVILTSTPAK